MSFKRFSTNITNPTLAVSIYFWLYQTGFGSNICGCTIVCLPFPPQHHGQLPTVSRKAGLMNTCPHSSTVYLALLYINPAVKTGKSICFTPIPYILSKPHASEGDTTLALQRDAFPLPYSWQCVLHDEPPSSVRCLHVNAWFTERQPHVIAAPRAFSTMPLQGNAK